MTYTLHTGDCRDVMATLPAESVDAIVCDPPYGLSFMGKGWDHGVPGVDFWAEALRVLKPGGHLIAFGGTRTYHRLAVAIEDAGFEVRDCLMWLYGSGFPKSLDVSKAMDKHGGVRVEFTKFRDAVIESLKQNGQTRAQLQDALGNFMISHYLTAGSQPAVPNYRDYCVIRDFCKMGDAWDSLFSPSAERKVVSETRVDMFGEYEVQDIRKMRVGMRIPLQISGQHQVAITAPSTDLAKAWHGWGTALKPAYEPAILARKPLRGTVADNVAQWGVGGLNIDGCRVAFSGDNDGVWKSTPGRGMRGAFDFVDGKGMTGYNNKFVEKDNGRYESTGRWPANVILDEEAAAALDAQSGEHKSGKLEPHHKLSASQNYAMSGNNQERNPRKSFGGDTGGASRFFYTAKASRSEREAGLDGVEAQRANHHPTVKPIALMRYMIRLVAPRGAVVLDPFMGSGSTGCAAMVEGMQFVGIDITPEYVDIARRRLAWWSCSLDGNAIIKTEEDDE